MKKIAYLLVMVALISSCGGNNEDQEISTPALPDPMVEMENTTELSEEDTEEISEEETTEETLEGEEEVMEEAETTETSEEETTETDTTISTDIRAELESGTENEQAVLEILNEIEEVFELAEQNGEQ